ncbi:MULTISPECIES: AMP-binding enzyme [Bradyrhizobium]|uniref:AMP-binding enzyme n=1 Tax=Bradyrhizobium TaxID=374 RepID=UPI00041CA55E|nr:MULTISPECIES: hypothetical protein [Bradyrhizobium]UFW51328.1 hypothetical protein BaraCB756_10205 [Bradyrhizobium arachidis]
MYPREVEAALSSFSSVRDCAVIGVPHPDCGEGVIAIVELKKAAIFDAKSTIADLSAQLAKYKIPKEILSCRHFQEMQWEKFKRTSSKKRLHPPSPASAVHLGIKRIRES